MADLYMDMGGVTGMRDDKPLRLALAQEYRRKMRRALFLTLPLLLFLIATFIVPIGQLLLRSVHNDDFSRNMPQLSRWFADNTADTAIDEVAFSALVADLILAAKEKTITVVGTRINYDLPGMRSLFTSTARKIGGLTPPFKSALIQMDPRWGDERLWQAMRVASAEYTGDFYLAAADLSRNQKGEIVRTPEERRIYGHLFFRTLMLAAMITGICLILAYPVAHLLATLPMAKSNLLMIFVLLPFWTSLLVRTTAWMVLLQEQGVLNNGLIALGLISDDMRLPLIYNQFGTVIAMTHILLPFMILPIYSVMRPINPSYVRAALSLGASSWTAFRRVYFPQTLPGVAAGVLLVFIMAIGYYITPALVGGASGQLISNMIAYHMQESLNWSLAAALAGILLAGVLILYWLYDRLVGIDNLKLG